MKGHRPLGLKVPTTFDNSVVIFTCCEWLDVRDQSILLAAIALAGLRPSEVGAESKSPIGQQLWSGLQPLSDALGGRALVLTTTYYRLLRAANLATRDHDYTRVRDSLYRLAQVGCRVQRDGYDWSMRLLSYVSAPDGEIHIAFNTRFADALSHGQHVRVCLEERSRLKNDTPKLLHAWLSAITRPGARGFWMGLDSVAKRIWGSDCEVAATQSWRRGQLVKALREIAQLGWGVEQKGRGIRHQMRVHRPKMGAS